MNRPDPNLDDREVIHAVLDGETDRFGLLVVKYQDRLFNGVARMLDSAADADDVLQDAFLQAFRKLSSFRENSSFYTWVYRIAINAAINLRRRRRRIVLLADESQFHQHAISSPDAGPEKRLEQSDDARELQVGLNQLSDEHRNILVLREIEGMSYEEISDVLQMPIGTVRSRLHRARLQLRDCLIARQEQRTR
jgi:RNA polymerase sigma-70 factor (ECF subfamily)